MALSPVEPLRSLPNRVGVRVSLALMARGKTKSTMSLKQRREKAFDLFLKGYSDLEVAQRLKVTRQTVNNYRRRYEETIHDEARSNPTLLREVVANTMRSLHELERVRSEAWKSMEDRTVEAEFTCTECGEVNVVRHSEPVSDQSRTQFLNVLLKAQDQRAKLFGVIGVKADMLVAVAQVKIIQEKIIRFIQTELDAASRERLEAFLIAEMPELSGEAPVSTALDAVDVEVLSESA